MDENVCEHGDHPAPAGRRFCSFECEACEHATYGINTCRNICGLNKDAKPHRRRRGISTTID